MNEDGQRGGARGRDAAGIEAAAGRLPDKAFRGRTPPTEGRPAPLWLRPLLGYQRAMDRVSDGVGAISKYLVIAVVAVGFGNALLRYIGRFSRSQLASNTYIELQWYLYATLFLLAFPYILKNGINVRVDFWFANRSERIKAVIDFVGHLIGLLPFCALGLWVVYSPIRTSWAINETSPDPGGLPRAPIKTVLFVGLALLLLQGLAEMVKLMVRLLGRSDLAVKAEDSHGLPIRAE